MNTKKIIITLCGILCITNCFSQSKREDSFINFSGSIGLFYDIYDFSQENHPNFRARFPDNLFRLNAQASLNFGKYFSIPIAVNITNQKTLYNLPSLPEESVIDYIQNPANNISINPKYKWIQAYFGTQTPLYSPLSTGDIPMFGAGIEINPGKFIFSMNYGISQRAVEPNISLNIPGAYEQKIIATRIGYGKLDGTKFTLNVVKVEDDLTSINTPPIDVDPIEGITISPYFQFKLGKKIEVRTETAASLYTSDLLNSGEIDEDFVEDLSDIIHINASSKVDVAHNTRVDWKGKKITLGGEIKYIGPGFLPVGYRFIERDIFDYKFNTSLKLFKEKINLTGSFGVRTNNSRHNKLASTKRIISNVNIFGQLTEKFSVNASYSNFGFNNDASLLNQRIELVNNSITISPIYAFKTSKINHQIGLNYGLNSFDQFNVVSNNFEKTKSNTYGFNYNLFFLKFPLNLNFQGLQVNNQMPTGNFNMLNYGLTASYKLWDKKITPSLAFNLAHIDKEGFTKDNRTSLRFKLKYKINKKLNFKLAYRFTGYKYGSSRPNASVNQNRIQFSIQQKF